MSTQERVQSLLEQVGQDTLNRLQIDRPTAGDCTVLLTFFSKLNNLLAAAPTQPAAGSVELPKLVKYKSTLTPKEEWRNEPIDYWLRQMLETCDHHDGLVIEATLTFLEELKTPAPEVEPVAWITENGDLYGREHAEAYDMTSFTPLYTHPADDGLRKASEELIAGLDNGSHCLTEIKNLRAELDKGKS